jgi:hypothetical protein
MYKLKKIQKVLLKIYIELKNVIMKLKKWKWDSKKLLSQNRWKLEGGMCNNVSWCGFNITWFKGQHSLVQKLSLNRSLRIFSF